MVYILNTFYYFSIIYSCVSNVLLGEVIHFILRILVILRMSPNCVKLGYFDT